VNQPRNPLRINIGFLANESIGSHRDLDFEFDELILDSELQLTNVKGEVRINRTPQGLLLNSKFQAFVVGQCVRCLEDFNQSLETEFQELYAYKTRHTRDEEYFVPEDGNIDLAPLVYQNLLLSIPIKALCKPECKGLCSSCGTNLNNTTCEHEDERVEY
jgi:uncharacterized protein